MAEAAEGLTAQPRKHVSWPPTPRRLRRVCPPRKRPTHAAAIGIGKTGDPAAFGGRNRVVYLVVYPASAG